MYMGFTLRVLFVYDLTTVEGRGQFPFMWGLHLLNKDVPDDYVKRASDCTFHVWQHIRKVA